MLRSKDEAVPGRVVYLYPHTRTAGQYCWMKKTAIVEDADSWPRVHVTLTHKGEMVHSYPHKDDIRLRPAPKSSKAEKREGDTNQGAEPITTGVRVMPGTVKPIVLAEGEEQGMLF